MKSQSIILGIALIVCVFAIKGFGRVSDALIPAEEGRQILYALEEELERREFFDESFVRIDKRIVLLHQGISNSWWNDVSRNRWGFRPISDSELQELKYEIGKPFDLMHLDWIGSTEEGYPKIRAYSMRYYWDNGTFFKRPAGNWRYFSVVKIDLQWRAVYLPPTGIP